MTKQKNWSNLCSEYSLKWVGPNWLLTKWYSPRRLIFEVLVLLGIMRKYKGNTFGNTFIAFTFGVGSFQPKGNNNKRK